MKILRWIDNNLEEVIGSIYLAGIVIAMSVQVIMRRFLTSSLPWPEELSRYLFIAIVGLCLSSCVRKNSHLRINILEVAFPVVKRPLGIFSDVAFLAVMIYFIKPGIDVIRKIAASGQLSPALQIPMATVYASFILGFFLCCIRLVQHIILTLLHKLPDDHAASDGESGNIEKEI